MPESALKILFVDDDEALVRLAAKELARRRGMTVTPAHRAADAFAILRDQRFDAIVLDHFMPGSDGLETLAELQAQDDPPPILYVTAAEDGRIAVAALKAGAADYVIKDTGEAFFDLLAAAIVQSAREKRIQREKAAAEQAVREARDRAEWLLREVNHRCANSLQLVCSLVSMQATHIKDAGAKQALLETVSRINAVGQVHRRLYSSDDVRTVEMSSYLEGLLHELRSVMGNDADALSVRLDAEPVRIPTDRAITLGVIVSELVTNAVKYAYPDGKTGEVRVTLKQDGEDHVSLEVSDDGVGWSEETQPRGSGLGMRIIAAMTDSLKGEIARKNGKGASVSLRLPAKVLRAPPEDAP